MKTREKGPLTVKETADALGLSVHTIRAWIAQRKLAHVRLGRSIRVLPSVVEQILSDCTVKNIPKPTPANNPMGRSANNTESD